jgi:prefoldin subunit 5
MTEQEVQTIEENIDALKQTISILTQEKTALEERIAVLEAVRASLTQLLPHKKRTDRLLS